MTLHPHQEILGAVQEGTCSEPNDINPYKPEDVKKYCGWKQGYENAVKDHKLQQKIDGLSLLDKLKCRIGIHKYKLKRIPGRPHINPKTGKIDRRDPIIKKYTCVRCNDTYFIGLNRRKRK